MIRDPTPDELEDILGFFDAIERRLSAAVLDDLELAVVDRDGARVAVLVAPGLSGLDAALLGDADHAGLRIGTLEEDGFRLDLQGAIRMSGYTRKLTVRVNEKATRLWLYGRDILGDSVLAFDKRLRDGDACIVCNTRWEAIGIGEVVGRFKGPEAAVRPLHDLGAYLRDQD